jgi:hypothetical protein
LIQKEVEHIENHITLSFLLKWSWLDKNFLSFMRCCSSRLTGNAINSTSSTQVRYTCAAPPNEMNAIHDTVRRPVDITALRFDLSTLHVWIRFSEYFLHTAYWTDIKKWQARGDDNCQKVKTCTELIQTKFRSEMCYWLTKQSLEDAEPITTVPRWGTSLWILHTASITGLNEHLISRCTVILQTLSGCHTINLEAFEHYVKERATLLVKSTLGTIYHWVCLKS